MYETLIRSHDVSQVPALQTVAEVSDRLKKAEAVREVKRLRQIAAGHRTHEPHGEKRKRGEETPGEELPASLALAEAEDCGNGKRLKADEMDDTMEGDVSRSLDESSPTTHAGASTPVLPAKISVSKAMSEVRGHTSYLTFAILLPPMPVAPEGALSQGLLPSLQRRIDIDVHCY